MYSVGSRFHRRIILTCVAILIHKVETFSFHAQKELFVLIGSNYETDSDHDSPPL